MLHKLIFTILSAALLTCAGATTSIADLTDGCGDGFGTCDGSGDGGGFGYRRGYGKGIGDGAMDGSCLAEELYSIAATDLTTGEIDSLLFLREEEKLARDSYLVLGELWDLVIFDNIAVAEQKHMDALKKLIDCYRLTDPALVEVGAFTNQDLQTWFDWLMAEGVKSVMDGLYVGTAIEETDIAGLQTAIDETVNIDLLSTYESLVCASRNHLRSFIGLIEINGGSYVPAALEPEVFWDIAHSEMEQGCGHNGKK
ncbi:MAG: DUF2202 domain-containing protein [Lysobacterales bacterium]